MWRTNLYRLPFRVLENEDLLVLRKINFLSIFELNEIRFGSANLMLALGRDIEL